MTTAEAIYYRAKAGDTFVSSVDTAKLVRARLKAEFPGVKFSVRTHQYSNGSSIYVVWEDGPVQDAVDCILKPYQGSGFDGSIDLRFYVQSFLTRDGRAFFAQTTGTTASKGEYPARRALKPCPSAVRVSFAPDYVFAVRRGKDVARDALASINAWHALASHTEKEPT